MSLSLDLVPEMQELIDNIATKNMYSGNKISDSVMKLFEIEVKENSTGILAPYWIPVLQVGRGPRKGRKDTGLWKKIFAWMQKYNMFRSDTTKGRINEAKGLTWYINKYGNQQFRNKVFVDIYESERAKTIKKIEDKYSLAIGKITIEIL